MSQYTRRCGDPITPQIERQVDRDRADQAPPWAAGAALDNVIKCNVYCTDPEFFGQLNAVCARYFPETPPARSFVCVLPWHGPFDVEIDGIARTGIGNQ